MPDTNDELENKLQKAGFTKNEILLIQRLYKPYIQSDREKAVKEAWREGYLAGRNVHADEITQLDLNEVNLLLDIFTYPYYKPFIDKLEAQLNKEESDG